jgi:hypothetical protein
MSVQYSQLSVQTPCLVIKYDDIKVRSGFPVFISDDSEVLSWIIFREFLKSLALFNKPLVAGVHGAAVGLGVTMLPFFDMVFASDKATFYTPYAKLGQVPEGAAILTLPHMLGNAVVSTFALVDCSVYHYLCSTILYVLFALVNWLVTCHSLLCPSSPLCKVRHALLHGDQNAMSVHCPAHTLRLIAEFI